MEKGLPANIVIHKGKITNEFFIIIPVFNVSDAWQALKISHRKLVEKGKDKIRRVKAVSVLPILNHYVCTYGFQSDLGKIELGKVLSWDVYELCLK